MADADWQLAAAKKGVMNGCFRARVLGGRRQAL